jgi:hypothetical protein
MKCVERARITNICLMLRISEIVLNFIRKLAQLKLYLNCKFKISIRPTYKIQVTRTKFNTISKILNTSQTLVILCLSMHYIYLRSRGNNYKRDRTEPAHMVRPCPKNGRRKIAQNSVEVDAKTKESTRKTE